VGDSGTHSLKSYTTKYVDFRKRTTGDSRQFVCVCGGRGGNHSSLTDFFVRRNDEIRCEISRDVSDRIVSNPIPVQRCAQNKQINKRNVNARRSLMNRRQGNSYNYQLRRLYRYI